MKIRSILLNVGMAALGYYLGAKAADRHILISPATSVTQNAQAAPSLARDEPALPQKQQASRLLYSNDPKFGSINEGDIAKFMSPLDGPDLEKRLREQDLEYAARTDPVRALGMLKSREAEESDSALALTAVTIAKDGDIDLAQSLLALMSDANRKSVLENMAWKREDDTETPMVFISLLPQDERRRARHTYETAMKECAAFWDRISDESRR